jgi:hypothetical protein
MRRLRRRWPELRRQAGPWFLAFVGNVIVTGWIYALVEHVGPLEGPWWALVTGSTTGYGDLYPHSTAGRGIAAYLILSSIVLDRIFSAKLVAVMVEEPHLYSDAEQERDEARGELELELLSRLLRERGLDPTFGPAWDRYSTALERVQREESPLDR